MSKVNSKFKNISTFILTSVMGVVIVVFTLALSFGWLAPTGSNFNHRITEGSVVKQYFHCGEGTEEDPFVITRPIHYYHLVELYQRIPSFSTHNYYFQLGYQLDNSGELKVYGYNDDGTWNGTYTKELNMQYYSGKYALLPVGTSEIPFNGTFDGSDLTIKNLNIIASETINGVTYATSDVGIFGYLGESTSVHNVYFDNLTINLTGIDLTRTTEDADAHSQAVHTSTGSTEMDIAYVGYIAGHVRIGSTVQDVYVNNCEIIGGHGAENGFGFFGQVEDEDGNPVTTLGSEVADIRGAGDDAGWGGSIDMKVLHSRLAEIASSHTNRTPQYVSAETVIINEVTGEKTVTPTAYTNVTQKRVGGTNSMFYYFESEAGGSINFLSTSTQGKYMGLFGENRNYTKTVTTYTYLNEFLPAMFISSGDNYLTVNGTNLSNSTTFNEETTAKWLTDNSNHIYTVIDAVKYYLNLNGTTGDEYPNVNLRISTTPSTTWTISNSDQIYTTSGGHTYYIIYSAGWIATYVDLTYRISDGNGNYLNGNTTTVSNVTDINASVRWVASNASGASTLFYAIIGTTNYYLRLRNGALEMSTTSTTWYKDGNGYYAEENGIRYYIGYDNGWKAIVIHGYKIYDGSSHYLVGTTNSVNNTNENNATIWQLSNPNGASTTIHTFINGIKYYLNGLSGNLTVNTTSCTWYLDSKGYYCDVSGIKFYLTYDNSWKIIISEGYYIASGTQHYLTVNNASTIKDVFQTTNATPWIFSNYNDTATVTQTTISYIVGGNRVYLTANNGSLSLSTNSYSFNQDNVGIYETTSNGDKLYVFYNSTWRTDLLSWYLITDNTNYLSATNTTVINTTDSASSVKWCMSNPTGNSSFYTYINGTCYYLGLTNGALTLTTNSATWTKDANGYYITKQGQNYYLMYDNGWKADIISGGYKINDGTQNSTNYLTATTNALSNSTEAAAVVWFKSSEGATTKIYTIINDTKYYLRYNNGLSIGTTDSNNTWNVDGNSLYITSSGVDYYLQYRDNAWIVDDINYYVITDGTNYLSLNNAGNYINTTNEANALHIEASSTAGNASGTYSFKYNGTTYYIYNNNGTLARSTSSTSWTNNGSSIYVTNDTYTYAICYENNTWQIKTINNGKVITDGNGNYLQIIGTGTTDFTNTTNINNATRFTFGNGSNAGKISYVYNNTTVYLRANGGTFELYTGTNGDRQTTWSYQDDGIITRIYYNTYTLICENGTWRIRQISTNSGLYYIKNGSNYLTVRNGAIANTTSENDACKWQGSILSNDGNSTISTTVNGTTYYLSCTQSDNGALSVVTSGGLTWRRNGTKLYYRTGGLGNRKYYYIANNNTNWVVRTNENNGTSLTLNEYQDPTVRVYSIVDTIYNQNPVMYCIEKVSNIIPVIGFKDYVNNSNLATTDISSVVNNTTYGEYSATPNGIKVEYNNDVPSISFTEYHETFELGLDDTLFQNYTKDVETGVNGGAATFFPVRVDKNENGTYPTDYAVSMKNTGYIISGANNIAYQENSGDIRISRYAFGQSEFSSFNLGNSTNNGSSYSAGRFEIITQNIGGQFRISDDYNKNNTNVSRNISSITKKTAAQLGYSAYTAAREQLDGILSSDPSNVYGLHFMDAAISIDRLVTAPQAVVLGRRYYNYEMPQDSIDFKVIDRGSISFFAGTYYMNSGYENNSFFSLHQIFRDANQKITAIKEIKYVYMNSLAGRNANFIYMYTDGTYGICDNNGAYTIENALPSGYELVFDTDWITHPTNFKQWSCYYFEIPCNKGEYALGSVAGRTENEHMYGAYLFYLDIASNGGEVISTTLSNEGNEVTTAFKVDFRDATDTVNTNIIQLSINIPDTATTDNYSVKVIFDENDVGNDYTNGCYKIYITNKTGTQVDLSVFLCDDDMDIMTPFMYAYKIYYSNGSNNNTLLRDAMNNTDYYKAVGTFAIPATGTAMETSYS